MKRAPEAIPGFFFFVGPRSKKVDNYEIPRNSEKVLFY